MGKETEGTHRERTQAAGRSPGAEGPLERSELALTIQVSLG